ncbi:MAG: methylenetetrahydrofolate reductase C-terminal domain-containing protein [Armatimonadetes bacterium]|nr:methylenetetrahydrofolate reductase C-terminal domain-containing protein [Armatimonadota bacterium]
MSKLTEKIAAFIERHPTLYRIIFTLENAVKKPLFDCRECGQCILSSTALICPMRCPKELRDGPCGGTLPNGRCEVDPNMDCVWYLIYKRADKLDRLPLLDTVQKPYDNRLRGTSAWINLMAGRIEGVKLRARPKKRSSAQTGTSPLAAAETSDQKSSSAAPGARS